MLPTRECRLVSSWWGLSAFVSDSVFSRIIDRSPDEPETICQSSGKKVTESIYSCNGSPSG